MKQLSWILIAATSVDKFVQAPATDRAGFPEGYQNWTKFYVLDRSDNKQVRTIYGN